MVMSLILLTGCSLFKKEKQTPIFTGMNISALKHVVEAPEGPSTDIIQGGSSSGDVSFNANYSGDTSDRITSFDKNNPFPENGADKTIEEAIKSSVSVPGAVDFVFYADANQEIFINIHLYNPDYQEIVSLTLNGVTYTSDTFELESDSRTILIKQNIGEVSGIVEYTVSDIKYADEEGIKDVIMEGENTALAGVKGPNGVSASITETVLSTNDFSVNFEVTDPDGLVSFSNGTVKAILYDGSKIVAAEDVAVGKNFVKFTNLKTNTRYQYAIVAYYDDLSGLGFGMHILCKDAFHTDPIVVFDDITVNNDGIDFDFLWDDSRGDEVPERLISAMYLYRNDERINMFGGNRRSITGLLSDTAYTLVADYIARYLEDGTAVIESICINFTTLKKEIPQISVYQTSETRTSIEFGINKIDNDNVATITSIELLYAGTVIDTITGDELETKRIFENLSSDKSYTVRISYVYDLNDGTGEHAAYTTRSMSTVRTIPQVSLSYSSVTQTSFSINVTESDTFDYGKVAKIALLCDGETILEDETGLIRYFDNLLSGKEYVVVLTYVYDLEDGNPEQTVIRTLRVSTYSIDTPIVEFTNSSKTQTSIAFDVIIYDADNVASFSSIELFIDGAIKVDSDPTASKRSYDNLLSNTTYVVALTYSYNLNDGNPTVYVTEFLTITTDAKATPEAIITQTASTGHTVSFEVHETDVDSVGGIEEIKLLYAGGEIVADSLEQRLFTDLIPNTTYTIWVKYIYDLNDVYGRREVILTSEITTDQYVGIEGIDVGASDVFTIGDTMQLQISLDNPMGIIARSVVINGITYNVRSATVSTITVDVPVNNSFIGGTTLLTVDLITGALDGEELSLNPDGTTSREIFINGEVEVLGATFVDHNFQPIDWARPRDAVYLLITLNNPSDYYIHGYTKYDDNSWYCSVSNNIGWNVVSINELVYSNGRYVGGISAPDVKASFYRVSSNDTIYVSTPEQLMNMADGYYYELVNDIDLTGFEWSAPEFNGVLDGKGYTIKNASVSITVHNANAYAGLFGKGTGIVRNLDLDGIKIFAGVSVDDENVYSVYCGGLIGYGTDAISIYNCSITNSTVEGISLLGNAYVGGFIGHASNVAISNCRSDASVGSTFSAGGLIGYARYAVIENCENSGRIGYKLEHPMMEEDSLAPHYAGGIVGYLYSGNAINCRNSGDVSYAAYCGGIAGAAKSSNILSSHNSGSIFASLFSDGLVGERDNTLVIDSTNTGSVKANAGV